VVPESETRGRSCAVIVTEIVRANYITNLSLSEISGGWSGFNAAIFASLARHYSLKYVGPISPPPDVAAKMGSKLRRLAGLPGSFQFFSARRLARIASEIARAVDENAALDFFHGSTPWIAFEPTIPYACYLDASFSTYISVYHERSRFDRADVARIERLEAAWLAKASRIFFSSEWALEKAARAYDLDRSKMRVAGLGGHLPIPSSDAYAGGNDFLFLSLDFAGKGGQLCVDALTELRREIPDARLRIVGARPPERALGAPGIVYEGLLSKSVPRELQRLESILAASFALVHPTVRDATPQVIAEAAYHGCPAIAPRSFGIPEMVADGVTGWLVAAPPTSAEIAQRMLWMCQHPREYQAMRVATRERGLREFTWERVGDRIAEALAPVLA
jgi:glycosyltransferase involved in cell wall biosynthesis